MFAPAWLVAPLNRRMLILHLYRFRLRMLLYLLLNLLPLAAYRRPEPEGDGAFAPDPVSLHLEVPLGATLLDRWHPPHGQTAQLDAGPQSACWRRHRLARAAVAGRSAIVVALTAAIALFSATLDIALDAFRRELLPDEELGLSSTIVNATASPGWCQARCR